MEKKVKIIYVDMDEVIADFTGSKELSTKRYNPPEMYNPGFFLNLEVKPGAQRTIQQFLRDGYDVQILTQPVALSPLSYTEKVQWIMKHFPCLSHKINMTQEKGLFVGEYLIDDNLKWKDPFEKNGGKFIFFNPEFEPEYMWEKIYETISLRETEELNELNQGTIKI